MAGVVLYQHHSAAFLCHDTCSDYAHVCTLSAGLLEVREMSAMVHDAYHQHLNITEDIRNFQDVVQDTRMGTLLSRASAPPAPRRRGARNSKPW